MELQSYASDILEDAMVLAQCKSINSFSFRDMINTLTELWGYCFEKIVQIDAGYYIRTRQLTSKLTHLPPFVKNTVGVYASRGQVGFSRKDYITSGRNDLNASGTFHLSGNDLYCWDADLRQVWLEWVPEPPFCTFTKNNRDYKILWRPGEPDPKPEGVYTNRNFNMYALVEGWDNQVSYTFIHRGNPLEEPIDRTEQLVHDGWDIVAFILDPPWTFITYKDKVTEWYKSYVIEDLLGDCIINEYNPFDFTGRPSNVQYLTAKYNDYTGMGVIVLDHNDGIVKELGWTPDTLMIYPSRIVRNYMVATVAQRFAAMNGSQIMAVEMAVAQSTDEMGNWLKKNKSAWSRAKNVTGPVLADFL